MSHDHGHDAHASAGHAETTHVPSGDPHALPPEPAERWITPAPEDFARTPPLGDLAWPLLWAAVVVIALLAVRASGWHVPEHGEPATPHAAPGH